MVQLRAANAQTRPEAGIFEGYASLFSVADLGGDIVMPGAFRNSLRKRTAKGVRMLFQHDPAQPIGRWLDIRETTNGLYVKGQLSLDVQRAAELSGLLRDGAIDGLSIGFKTITARRDRLRGMRCLYQVDLWEISLVTFPMLASARVMGRKANADKVACLGINNDACRQPTRVGDSARAVAYQAARLRRGAAHLSTIM